MTAHALTGGRALVGTDLSARSGSAARWGAQVARVFGWAVVVGHVFELEDESGPERGGSRPLEIRYRHAVRDWYEEQTGRSAAAVRLSVGNIAEQLARLAVDAAAAVLVVSASHRGIVDQLAGGSTPLALMRRPPCPLAVVHPDFERIDNEAGVVAGTDFTPTADIGIRAAAEVAQTLDRPLHLVHASRPDHRYLREEYLPEGLRRIATASHRGALMKRVIERTSDALERVQLRPRIIDDLPARGLCRYVEQVGADLTVMGPPSRSGYTPAVVRSVALRCAHLVESTLLVVPRRLSSRSGR